MSSLLELAGEFIDRMTNPAYGALVNEEYALRLGSLLDRDLDARLIGEAIELRTTDALSLHGWNWLLNWTANAGVRLDHDLLLDLCETWDSAAFKATVIDVATRGRDPRTQHLWTEGDLAEAWLFELLARAIQQRGEEPESQGAATGNGRPAYSPYTNHVYSLLIALVQVESEVTLNAAAVLLREPWEGHDSLLEFFWARMDTLDPETREAWQTTLTPPDRRLGDQPDQP